ncbi:probable G-protein coupled receptor 139 [Scyliorhinus canicula]|uniref:probable G-protein coupled receptor 139 n=1 Tax=Scyliorhinus canicula TaxID=7830 RepID=UPI0018F7C8BA|nr:probable G-protein coupled receptor 139 [Scyliorhinus canicula]
MDYPAIYHLERIYYPVLAAIGIPVNLIAIVILYRGKCGLSKCTIRYLLSMAAADVAVLLIHVVFQRINVMYLSISFLFTYPANDVNIGAYVVAVDCSVWFTVSFTFDRCIAICFQTIHSKYCTKNSSAVVITTIFVASCLKSIPFYCMFETDGKLPWFCDPTADYLTSPLWKAFEWFDSILTPLLPIILMLFFNVITVRHIFLTNRIRKSLRSASENVPDPELQNRRKSMILLFSISANFILLWLIYVIHSVTYPVTNFLYGDKYFSSHIHIFQQVGFMLQLLSCCTNSCIYGLTQRKFRAEMKTGFQYIFTLNGTICQHK